MPTNETESTETTQVVEPRSISILLHILAQDETYQGMTDAEIQSIVDYEKNLSYLDGKSDQIHDNQTQHNAAMRTMVSQSLQAQESMLQSIVDRATSPQLQVVQYG